MSELETLKECWLLIDGNEMPQEIAEQPIEIVRKAVHWLAVHWLAVHRSHDSQSTSQRTCDCGRFAGGVG